MPKDYHLEIRLRARNGAQPASDIDQVDVSIGSFSTKLGYPRHVRFTPGSDRIADMGGGPVGAKSGSEPARNHLSTVNDIVQSLLDEVFFDLS
jgi:hypothetical protein